MNTGVVAIVGVGHAGQIVAQLLHRSGVARLRLIDTAAGVAGASPWAISWVQICRAVIRPM